MAPLYVLAGVTALLLLTAAVVPGWSIRQRWPTALRFGLAAMFAVTGLTHFAFLRDDLIAMVPPALPAPEVLVTVTGILELGAAAALLVRRTAAWAAAGLGALLIAMFPANVHAALSGVELAGEPATALLPRTAIQVIFLAATVTVLITHRRAAARLIAAVPPAHGPARSDASGGGVTLVSRLELRSRRDVPGFLLASLRLRRSFQAAPGAITLRLAADPLSRTFWTWSYWSDEAALRDYTRSALHRQIMDRYRSRMQDSRFERLDPALQQLPRGWAAARKLVEPVTRSEHTVPVP